MSTQWLEHSFEGIPRCRWRVSARAKYLRLVVHPHQVLELVAPKGTSQRAAGRFLKQQQHWVRQQLSQRPVVPSSQIETFPSTLNLRAIDQQWCVHYQPRPQATLQLSSLSNELFVTGNVGAFDACLPLLKRWLKQQAEQHISPQLRDLSDQYHLPFQHLSFRFQRTRWGSCSEDKNINLNGNLLFLPLQLMRHVLLHELCHTQVMNHSHDFWQLLESLDPSARQHDRALREADQYLPAWLYHGALL